MWIKSGLYPWACNSILAYKGVNLSKLNRSYFWALMHMDWTKPLFACLPFRIRPFFSNPPRALKSNKSHRRGGKNDTNSPPCTPTHLAMYPEMWDDSPDKRLTMKHQMSLKISGGKQQQIHSRKKRGERWVGVLWWMAGEISHFIFMGILLLCVSPEGGGTSWGSLWFLPFLFFV